MSGPEVSEADSAALLVIDASPARIGGGASRVAELLDGLPHLAPDRELVVYAQSRLASAWRDRPNLTVRSVPRSLESPGARLLWQHFALPRKLRGKQVRWLLSPFNTLPLGPGLGDTIRTAVIVSNIAPFAPEIWGAFGLYQRTRLRLLRALTTRSLHRADLIFLLSAEAEQRLEAFAQTGKIVRIPMAPPNPALVEEARRIRLPKKIEDRPFFFVAGDLLPYKQFEEAIQAACIVGDRQVRLLISGTSLDAVYAHRLRRLARGSPGKIAFLGAQPHVRTLAYMHRAVATLVCSRLENPSRIPTEAMAMGCPVIAADTPNYREGCGDAAVYYTPGDFRALAHAMHALLEERTRDKLRDHGRRRVASMDWLDASRAILRAMNLLPRPDVGGTTKSP